MSCGIGTPGPDQHPIGRKCWTRASRHEQFEDLVSWVEKGDQFGSRGDGQCLT